MYKGKPQDMEASRALRRPPWCHIITIPQVYKVYPLSLYVYISHQHQLHPLSSQTLCFCQWYPCRSTPIIPTHQLCFRLSPLCILSLRLRLRLHLHLPRPHNSACTYTFTRHPCPRFSIVLHARVTINVPRTRAPKFCCGASLAKPRSKDTILALCASERTPLFYLFSVCLGPILLRFHITVSYGLM
ncbi:hypothetical protein BGW80DRAFT_735113 [Lactifluus volemus]|nr:hypothetical protein BGW80DRAFT_735113 [Lactifluus volemus]